MIQVSVTSEYGKLETVILASIENYRVTSPINVTQKHYYDSNPPRLEKLLAEQMAFVNLLKLETVNIHWAKPISECPYQVNTRDIATIIGTTLIVGNPRREIRRNEVKGIEHIIKQIPSNILRVPSTAFLEGGDIVLDGSTIYVGIGERTDINGLNFIKQNFPQYETVPVHLAPGILHLDVVFNILPKRNCIIYLEGIKEPGLDYFINHFEQLIHIEATEQFDLATNVFAVNTSTLVADPRNKRVNIELARLGFDIRELDFTETTKIGGAFRCATMPLIRL